MSAVAVLVAERPTFSVAGERKLIRRLKLKADQLSEFGRQELAEELIETLSAFRQQQMAARFFVRYMPLEHERQDQHNRRDPGDRPREQIA